MPGPTLEYTAMVFNLYESLLERMRRVMYLQPPPWEIEVGRIREVLQNKLDKTFAKVVKTNLKAYMTEGKEPPAAIAASIKNFADDLVAGREMVVRSGDYFAIQNYIKENKVKG
jgi:hypothetical protein